MEYILILFVAAVIFGALALMAYAIMKFVTARKLKNAPDKNAEPICIDKNGKVIVGGGNVEH